MSWITHMPTITLNLKQKLDKEITSVIKSSKHKKVFLSYSKNLTYDDFLSNKLLMRLVIREGVPYSLFDLIQS